MQTSQNVLKKSLDLFKSHLSCWAVDSAADVSLLVHYGRDVSRLRGRPAAYVTSSRCIATTANPEFVFSLSVSGLQCQAARHNNSVWSRGPERSLPSSCPVNRTSCLDEGRGGSFIYVQRCLKRGLGSSAYAPASLRSKIVISMRLMLACTRRNTTFFGELNNRGKKCFRWLRIIIIMVEGMLEMLWIGPTQRASPSYVHLCQLTQHCNMSSLMVCFLWGSQCPHRSNIKKLNRGWNRPYEDLQRKAHHLIIGQAIIMGIPGVWMQHLLALNLQILFNLLISFFYFYSDCCGY